MNSIEKALKQLSSASRKNMLLVAIFAVAMGWLEAVVVVYMRLLFYPEGFDFPLKMIPWNIGVLELLREVATLAMLVIVGMLAGRKPLEKFAYLLMAFGIWDIIYYLGLRLSLGWPVSLLSWDLLFLIPLPWVGPVLAPVLVAVAMILAAVLIILQEDRKRPLNPIPLFWALEIAFGLTIILSFILDYRMAFADGPPNRYRWGLFLVGYVPGVLLFLYTWWHAETYPPAKPKKRKKSTPKKTTATPALKSEAKPAKQPAARKTSTAGRENQKIKSR